MRTSRKSKRAQGFAHRNIEVIPLKITFLIASFPPEISTGRLGFQLCKSFTSSGHSVTVVTSFPRKYLVSHRVALKGRLLYREDVKGLNVVRMGPEFSKRDNVNMRGLEYFYQFFSLFVGGLVGGETDIIMCCSPPLTLALASYFLGRIKRAPIVVRIGDLHPQELVDLGLIKNKMLVHLLELMEKFVYRKTDCLTVLSKGYRQHLLSKGTESSKVIVLPNWGDLDELAALRKPGALSEFKGKFVVTYAGVLSWFQDVETLVDAASLLQEKTDIHFLIVGDGSQKQFLEEKSKRLKLQNVTFKPLQPRAEYLRILQSSAVCVIAIKKELKTTTIPSKLFDIMACGRPVLAIVPKGETTGIISNSKCGSWVEPQNPGGVAEAVLALYRNPSGREEFGRNGRKYLEEHFTLKRVSIQHEEIMHRLIKRGNRVKPPRLDEKTASDRTLFLKRKM